MLAREVFQVVCRRLSDRARELELFLESGHSFESWLHWEAYAACRLHGWMAQLRPAYASAGLMGSRDDADLLARDPASARRVLVELAVICDWTTNRWIAPINLDTANLSRPLSPDVESLQLILAASPNSGIEVNRQWKGWLGMTSVWSRPTDLQHSVRLGQDGEALLRGWVLRRVADRPADRTADKPADKPAPRPAEPAPADAAPVLTVPPQPPVRRPKSRRAAAP
jgi:hypothetical protein